MTRYMDVIINGASDYGFYGRTGVYKPDNLPIDKCCSTGPLIVCKYDDIPGWRETSYYLICKDCNIRTNDTCMISKVIEEWNEKVSEICMKKEINF